MFAVGAMGAGSVRVDTARLAVRFEGEQRAVFDLGIVHSQSRPLQASLKK